jgi:tRNA modification GTPase
MTLQLNDTIAALASPPGPGARGIIRVSGDDVRSVLDGVFTPHDRGPWESSRLPLRHQGVFRFADSEGLRPGHSLLYRPTDG